MYGMFNGVTVFNTDISSWKTNSLNETQVSRKVMLSHFIDTASLNDYLNPFPQ